ncbi:hypothetical protein GALMADRAFT_137538 [Galerina marginata CBS 339.88]|uniref:Uncharacterized protein n=1 Tax=Galerina marginata (strain CBS 339.88) TaxID=685588 RepID=A0A067T5N6_GALM3|nr:hypothetical protein GALMADRAFT_137538 [Galerina marginata CBS 339.88]
MEHWMTWMMNTYILRPYNEEPLEFAIPVLPFCLSNADYNPKPGELFWFMFDRTTRRTAPMAAEIKLLHVGIGLHIEEEFPTLNEPQAPFQTPTPKTGALIWHAHAEGEMEGCRRGISGFFIQCGVVVAHIATSHTLLASPMSSREDCLISSTYILPAPVSMQMQMQYGGVGQEDERVDQQHQPLEAQVSALTSREPSQASSEINSASAGPPPVSEPVRAAALSHPAAALPALPSRDPASGDATIQAIRNSCPWIKARIRARPFSRSSTKRSTSTTYRISSRNRICTSTTGEPVLRAAALAHPAPADRAREGGAVGEWIEEGFGGNMNGNGNGLVERAADADREAAAGEGSGWRWRVGSGSGSSSSASSIHGAGLSLGLSGFNLGMGMGFVGWIWPGGSGIGPEGANDSSPKSGL